MLVCVGNAKKIFKLKVLFLGAMNVLSAMLIYILVKIAIFIPAIVIMIAEKQLIFLLATKKGQIFVRIFH